MSDSFSQDLVLSPLQLGYGEKYLMFTWHVTMTATTLLSQVTKHLRLCFHFCKFYNNQTRPGDKPRSFASDCDIITTSLAFSLVLYVLVQLKVTSIARSYIANDNDIIHQQIKGQVLIALSLVL